MLTLAVKGPLDRDLNVYLYLMADSYRTCVNTQKDVIYNLINFYPATVDLCYGLPELTYMNNLVIFYPAIVDLCYGLPNTLIHTYFIAN